MITVENLKKLGFKNLKQINDNIMMSCPFHEDNKPSFGINIDTGAWNCFSCGRKGKNIKSLAKILNMAELEKYFTYHSYSDLSNYVRNKLGNKKQGEYTDEFTYLIDYYKSNYTHDYLYSRGVKLDIAEKFNIGYDKENNALTFPVYTADNKFLGFTYRYLEGNFRYKHEFNKSVTLYGAQFLEKYDIILVEGNIDVLKAYSLGFKNIVGLMGTKINETQINLLKKFGNRIIIALDDDFSKKANWGRIATKRIIKQLINQFGTRLYIGEYKKGKKDFGDLENEEDFKIIDYMTWRLNNIE
jgi:DNA primase